MNEPARNPKTHPFPGDRFRLWGVDLLVLEVEDDRITYRCEFAGHFAPRRTSQLPAFCDAIATTGEVICAAD